MNVNFRALFIILLTAIVSGLLGGYIGFFSASKSALKVIDAQQIIIEMAIQKNTSEISNTFQNEFKKIKNKKGEPINIIIDPSTNSIITNDSTQVIRVEEKRGLFKRIFGK